jgi:hypothetical protein
VVRHGSRHRRHRDPPVLALHRQTQDDQATILDAQRGGGGLNDFYFRRFKPKPAYGASMLRDSSAAPPC